MAGTASITVANTAFNINLNGTGDFLIQDAGSNIFQVKDDDTISLNNSATDLVDIIGRASISSNLEITGGFASISGELNLKGGLEVAKGVAGDVAYSRFGADPTTHFGTIAAASDLLISGGLEVNGSAAFDGFTLLNNNASMSSGFTLEVPRIKVASISADAAITLRPGADSAQAFKIQNAAGSSTILRVDTSSNRVGINVTSGPTDALQVAGSAQVLARIGDSTDAVVLGNANNKGIRLIGNARNIKRFSIYPEYPGAVLTGNSSGSSGTMTSDNEASTSFRSYYQWTSTQTTTQEYKIFVRVPLPNDFDGFQSGVTVGAYKTKADERILFSIRDSANSLANVASASVATTAGSWTLTTSSTPTGTYASSSHMLFIFEMLASSSERVRLGSISFDYYSAF
mgnify:CR=1 FL=1